MQLLRITALALALASAPAFAQWQWIDKDGRKVFSDKTPPPEIPADKILRRPGARQAAASEPAPAPLPAPKLATKDKQLEDKKKQADAEADAKKKAQEEESAKVRDETCKRARRTKTALDSGTRLAQTNDKGETEVMDDAQRAAETKRIDGIIARDCKAAG